ncbi:MAG TPA: outer membrane lipoprotein chaperone LolA [Gammaproteobacteria bacterium]|jgi:chaperone LolA|nr:outer membrane lipoprotein chaperone LolA [Gammaproteobacteria bacterium]
MDSVKCLPRRLRVSIESLLFVIALALVHAGGAQPAHGDASATLDAFLSGVHSLTADFKQEIYAADERLLETDTGTLSLARPNLFRWSQAEPSELVVVADGKKLWTYDVELAQVTVAPLDDTVSSSPAMLLSGDRGVRDGFDVVETFSRDGLDWVRLAPKAGAADFSSVLIGFEGKSPRRLELVDGVNHITRIALANVVVNPELAAAVFEFKPPAGVHVLGGKG